MYSYTLYDFGSLAYQVIFVRYIFIGLPWRISSTRLIRRRRRSSLIRRASMGKRSRTQAKDKVKVVTAMVLLLEFSRMLARLFLKTSVLNLEFAMEKQPWYLMGEVPSKGHRVRCQRQARRKAMLAVVRRRPQHRR